MLVKCFSASHEWFSYFLFPAGFAALSDFNFFLVAGLGIRTKQDSPGGGTPGHSLPDQHLGDSNLDRVR